MFQRDTVINNRYRVIRPLGKGGFSQTFEVEDLAVERSSRKRVLKVLLEEYPKAVDLFRREAKVLSQLSHPGIPAVEADSYFTCERDDKSGFVHCFVMERVPGIDLRRWMENPRYVPISTAKALNWIFQMVDILKKIHQCQCFHRDIKPSNIILRPDGRLALIDFGAVREVTETYLHKCAEGSTRTHVYSRGYTPVEQMQGRAIPASDFFALGRTFVHLMTGCNPLEFPLDSYSGQLIWQHQAPQIIPSLAQLIDWIMAPSASQRPRTVDQIYQTLLEIKREFETGLRVSDMDATADTVLYNYAADPAIEIRAKAVDGTHKSRLPTQKTATSLSGMSQSDVVPPLDRSPHSAPLELQPLKGGDEPTELPPEYSSTSRSPSSKQSASPLRQSAIGQIRRLIQRMHWCARWPVLAIALWSGMVAGGITGLRRAGILQAAELATLDTLMQWRSPELPDPRILLITIDDSDLAFQDQNNMARRGSALSDVALYHLLEIIQPYDPSAIGLDIYRIAADPSVVAVPDSTESLSSTLNHLPEVPASEQLATQAYLSQYEALFVVCSMRPSIEPPPDMPLSQVGFVDFPVDPDRHIRRQILGMTPGDRCQTDKSISYQLAATYLAQQGINARLVDQTLYFGDRPVPSLASRRGGYYSFAMGGYEILTHYRKSDTVGRRVSLEAILSGQLDGQLESLVRNRLVLIGTVATSFRDYHETPRGSLAGVEIHAHMTSQILSAVLDDRPLIWVWPLWGETLWLWGWGAASVALVHFGRSPLQRWGGNGLLVVAMIGSGYLLFLTGGWIPLVPTAMTMAIAAFGCNAVRYRLQARSSSQLSMSLKTSTQRSSTQPQQPHHPQP